MPDRRGSRRMGRKMGEIVDLTQEKKRRKRAGSLAWLWKLLLMLAALLLGFGLAQSSLFNIRTIEVNGLSHLERDAVIALSELQPGEHIYSANIKKAETMIATNIWVQQVDVERKLPNTIVINVQERVPAAAVTTPDGLYIVDSGGVLLAQQKLLDGLSVLVVSGISDMPEDAKLGGQLESRALNDALTVIRQMSEEAAAVIAEIDVTNTQKIVARTTYGVDIYLGDRSDFAVKFKLAMQIMAEEESRGRVESIDYIDVSLTEQPVLAYLK